MKLAALLLAGLALPGLPSPRALAAPTAAPPGPEVVWLGAEGRPLPFAREEEVLDFLRTAREVSAQDLSVGVTKPKKLLLERGGVRAHVVFHSIDVTERKTRRLPNERVVQFLRDSYRSQVAAYELSRLLGMRNVPPTVARQRRGRPGSVQLWVENAMTEKKRRDRDLEPPDRTLWNQQKANQSVFDNLINNIDRNQGNTLIDADWNLWLIDHTRSFGHDRDLPYPERVGRVSRGLWEHLRALDEATVRERLAPYLREHEIEALLVRHQKLLQALEEDIQRLGESRVVFDWGDPEVEITVEKAAAPGDLR